MKRIIELNTSNHRIGDLERLSQNDEIIHIVDYRDDVLIKAMVSEKGNLIIVQHRERGFEAPPINFKADFSASGRL